MEVEFFWQQRRIGSSVIAPSLLEMGAVVVVKVPHPSPCDDVIDGAFVARAPDGREFALTVFRVKPDTASGAERTSTVSGYLRPKPN